MKDFQNMIWQQDIARFVRMQRIYALSSYASPMHKHALHQMHIIKEKWPQYIKEDFPPIEC